MYSGYGQFCPVAKAAEIFATRWTPLILRELMGGALSFNDIRRGLPLISRAVLIARLRELEDHGVVARCVRKGGNGHDYRLTEAGEAFRPMVEALGRWGATHGRERITHQDLDPTQLLWGFRRRTDVSALPEQRVVLRFEFSGVPANRTQFRIMWLVLERSGSQVCVKDPGFAVDLILRGNIRDFVMVYLGQADWRAMAGKALTLDGSRQVAKQLTVWLRLGEGSR